jgi:hypothetical protein
MAKLVEPYSKVTELVRDNSEMLPVDSGIALAGVVASPIGKSLQLINGPKEFLEKLVGMSELPRNSHVSLINAFYCSYFANLVIARSLNTKANSAALLELGKKDAKWVEVLMLNGSILNKAAKLTFSKGEGESAPILIESKTMAFVINGTVFYNMSDTEFNQKVAPYYNEASGKIAVKFSTMADVISTINSWSGMSVMDAKGNEAKIAFNADSTVSVTDIIKVASKVCVKNATSGEYAEENASSYITVADDSSSSVTIPDNYLLIECDEPGASDMWTITFTASGTNYKMGVVYGNNAPKFYEVSFLPDGVDADGNNIYIENFNKVFEGLQFHMINDESKTITLPNSSLVLGDSGVNLDECKKAKYFSQAVQMLGEQNKYEIEYLSDFGVTDPTFIKDYVYVGLMHDWFSPVDIPATYSNAQSMLLYSNAVRNTNNAIVAGPFDKNTSFLSWPTKIAWSSLYWERVFANRRSNKEYVGAFEETYGILSYNEPLVDLGESDRTSLLNGTAGPACFVVFNQQNGTYYLNMNRCHTTEENVLNEDGNRRMKNRIKRQVKKIMDQFKGRKNTNKTRSLAQSKVELYMNTEIMGLDEDSRPVEFKVVCDSSNNSTAIITARRMGVTIKTRLLGSVYWIDILDETYPLGVDFES